MIFYIVELSSLIKQLAPQTRIIILSNGRYIKSGSKQWQTDQLKESSLILEISDLVRGVKRAC